jgi:hypothetical protein
MQPSAHEFSTGTPRCLFAEVERYGFTPFAMLEGQSDARPRPTPLWLPIEVRFGAGASMHSTEHGRGHLVRRCIAA